MKTKKFKKSILMVIILPLMAFSCEEEKTNDIDITKWKWELRSVTSGNKNLSPQKNDYLRDDAYLLEFTSDSTFQLSTSVNFAMGSYHIIKNGDISISNYHEITEIATTDDYERELNDSLINVFNKVTSYEVINNTLIFKGEVDKMVFDKE